MANIVFKLGTLDLSNFIRVNPDEGLDLGQGDMLEPAFADSPLFEGQTLVSMHAKNKEQKVPLFLHPPTAPYTQDPLNQLIQQINQALRPIIDLGTTVYAQWQNAQASNPTFFTVQFARFEPNFNFRITEKGWLAGLLHLWVLPYAHTATERVVSTYAAPANQSGLVIPAASMTAAGAAATVVGDAPPQLDLRMTVGSYLGDDGRIGILAALPIPSYNPIVPVGSFFGLSPSAVIQGASGAWASQYLALDAGVVGASPVPGYFSFALSPASVYAGDNRVLGLVRARLSPFTLRAFDQQGAALGATVIASAMDGWQLVDYGTLRLPPWVGTAVVNIQNYARIDYSASGMVAPMRAAPAWTKEHGPIFVIPNGFSLLSLDWYSPALSIDGFDGAAGAGLAQDQLGQSWTLPQAPLVYNGKSGLVASTSGPITLIGQAGASSIDVRSDFEMEGVFTLAATLSGNYGVCLTGNNQLGNGAMIAIGSAPAFEVFLSGTTIASMAITFLPGQYSLRLVRRGTSFYANLGGPSGSFAGSASGAVASRGGLWADPTYIFYPGTSAYPGFLLAAGASNIGSNVLESFRARLLASQGIQSRDILHLHQPNLSNTRMNPSAIDIIDLQARQRGPIQAPALPVPSLGAGIFAASFPWDQGPANDLLNVDVRIRERFTYAR